MSDDDVVFDFETKLEAAGPGSDAKQEPPELPAEEIGQQPGNYRRNYRQTVCTFWLNGMCMKGDSCSFLHQIEQVKMPVCKTWLKYGECREMGCLYKHSGDDIKECNMYRLGFCIYGPQCRYKHRAAPAPPPEPETVEAAKPREARNINVVVNQVNPGVAREEERAAKRLRHGGRSPSPDYEDYGDGSSAPSQPTSRQPPPLPSAAGNGARLQTNGNRDGASQRSRVPPPRPPPGAPPPSAFRGTDGSNHDGMPEDMPFPGQMPMMPPFMNPMMPSPMMGMPGGMPPMFGAFQGQFPFFQGMQGM